MEASKLEPYLLLAKAAKGRAAAELINRATSDPGLFVFGELLEAAGIKEVCGHTQIAAQKATQQRTGRKWPLPFAAAAVGLEVARPSTAFLLRHVVRLQRCARLRLASP